MFDSRLTKAKPVKISRESGHIFLGSDTRRDLFEQKLERTFLDGSFQFYFVTGRKIVDGKDSRIEAIARLCTETRAHKCTKTRLSVSRGWNSYNREEKSSISSSTSSSSSPFSSFSSSSSSSSYASCLSRASTYENYNFPDSRRKFRD